MTTSPNVRLCWITPDAENQIVEIARVSSDPSKTKVSDSRLLSYLIRNQHWSPFEMASACIEITNVDRAVTRQILRHRSFHFQEFSQRYQDAGLLGNSMAIPARMQHPTNRQASVLCADEDIYSWWIDAQATVAGTADTIYREALERGIAKEVARAVLPEGLTPTRMMMSGTIRDWLHYCALRRGNGTQLEHQRIADAVWQILSTEIPTVVAAWDHFTA